MAMQLIPSHWVVRRSTPFFTRENVPQALLTHHNTAAGVFGQLCVMEGSVTYHGFADEQAEELRRWDLVLLAWRAQDWDTCDAGLRHLQRQNAEKVLYQRMAQRVAFMRRSPPSHRQKNKILPPPDDRAK